MRNGKVPYLIRKFFPDFANQYTYYREMHSKNQKEIRSLRNEITEMADIIKGVNSTLKDSGKVLVKIEKTNKDKEHDRSEYVILYKDKNRSPGIYLDIPFGNTTRTVLSLFTTLNIETMEMKIEDIRAGDYYVNKGYGSVALEYLINEAKEKNIKRIYGRIIPSDYEDNGERLMRFYEKFGFDVHICEDTFGGTIDSYL